MTLNLRNLDDLTRKYMLEELSLDIKKNKLCLGKYLSEVGKSDYPILLRSAMENGDIASLAESLKNNERLESHVMCSRSKSGMKKVPKNASEMLAEGEFNRFYIRAKCRRAIDESVMVIAYRARESRNPRMESLALEGKEFDPTELLTALRNSIGVEAGLGLPPGPNSGMSVDLAK